MSRRGAHSSTSTSGLDSQPPPFLTKTYDLVSDPSTDDIVSWSNGGKSFTVWKNEDFSRELLGKFFKHNNFSSFVRQLNTYGFRKVDSDRWEFYEENFQQGRRDLLHLIHRRKPSVPQAGHVPRTAIEVGQFGGIADEIDSLKRDKNVLMVELVRLRQQQAQSDLAVRQLQQRLEVTEARQSQMMTFLSKALQNPGMLQQLVSSRQNIGRLENGTSSRGAQRKKLKRRASKASDDMQQSDRESGEQMSDEPHADMSTALVQYHQHSPDFAAMLRGFPEISEVPSPTQSGSGGAGATAGWAADLSGMGSAFGGMQLSNSAGIVRASPVPSNVTILEQMDGAHGVAPQPGVGLGMPAIPVTSSALEGAGGHRLGGGGGVGGSFLSPPPLTALENGPVGGVPTVGATPLSRGAGQGLGSAWQPPEVSAANDSMLSVTDAGGDGTGIPAVTSVPISTGFPAAGSSPPFARIKPDPASDLVMAPNGGFDSFVGREQSASLPAGLTNGALTGAGGSGLGGVGGSGGSYGFDDFKLDLLKAPSGPADFMGDDDLWEQFMAHSPGASGALDAAASADADEASASKP